MVLGKVISGNINEGLKIILDSNTSIEDFPIGALIIIDSKNYSYLGIISNTGIDSNQLMSQLIMSSYISEFIKDILTKRSSGSLWNQWIQVALLAQTDGEECNLSDTIPSYGSEVREINEREIELFFFFV